MCPESFRILLALDDAHPGVELTNLLGASGFRACEMVGTGEAVSALSAESFDLLLLVANGGASEICRKIRLRSPGTRIIIVRPTVTLADEMAALAAGADDCIRPLHFRETVARIRAVLSRSLHAPCLEPELRAGDLSLDSGLKKVFLSGQQLHVAGRELDLLECLMRYEGQVLTHARLLREIWADYPRANRALLRSAVSALRRKIESHPARPEYILTEPWVGYRFSHPRAIFRLP